MVPSQVRILAPAPPSNVTRPTPTTIAAAGPTSPTSAPRRLDESLPTAGSTTSTPCATHNVTYQGIRNTRGA